MKHTTISLAQVRVCIALIAAIFTVSLSGEANAQTGNSRPYGKFAAEKFEYAFNNEANPLVWDAAAWVGGDTNRFMFETEGEMPTVDVTVEGEAEALYSRLIAPYWSFLVGVRGDLVVNPEDTRGRGHLVIGLEGMSRQLFDFEPAIYVSHEGDVSFRLEIIHNLRITQRLVAQSRFEADAAIQSVPEFGVGEGFNSLELGLRLRYEIVREFAPYIGVAWERSFGETADLKEAEGGSKSDLRGVAGIRFWF